MNTPSPSPYHHSCDIKLQSGHTQMFSLAVGAHGILLFAALIQVGTRLSMCHSAGQMELEWFKPAMCLTGFGAHP